MTQVHHLSRFEQFVADVVDVVYVVDQDARERGILKTTISVLAISAMAALVSASALAVLLAAIPLALDAALEGTK